MIQSVTVSKCPSTLTETIMNKADLIDAYAQQLLDSMDMKTMERFVYDTIVENLTDYTDEELITEVTDYYPELLESA